MHLKPGQRVPLNALLDPSRSFVIGIRLAVPGVDVDCTCFALDGTDRAYSDDYVTFFNQPTSPCLGVSLAAPAGDDQGFEVCLDRIPEFIERLVVTAAIDGDGRFGDMRPGSVRLIGGGREVARFELEGALFADQKALILMEIYRREGEWRLTATGQGFNGGLAALVHHFGLDASDGGDAPQPRPLPPVSLLTLDDSPAREEDLLEREAVSRAIEQTLAEFKVKGKVTGAIPGPVVTTYALAPAPGVRVSRVVNLGQDLALRLSASGLRIDPIFVDGVIGVEVPNKARDVVQLRRVMQVTDLPGSPLMLALGVNSRGTPIWVDLEELPHLLVAGTTRSGKSVALHAILSAILLRASESDVRLMLVDPKRSEFTTYEGIPHLLAPVLTDPRQAATALDWLTSEMDDRYVKMEKLGVRNRDGWRMKVGANGFVPPLLLVVIDELADLILQSGRSVEEPLVRIAQMGRAAGIHLILATQRPSRDVLTSLIKANIPARLAFRVTSSINSNIILDTGGAENLLGSGDGLLWVPGQEILRIQAPMVTPDEVGALTRFFSRTRRTLYEPLLMQRLASPVGSPA